MEPVENRSDIRSKVISASPAQVFAAIQDPARIARWWGPDGFTSTIHCFEFVPGGRWLLTMHGPDGKDYPNESRFTRIVPDRLFEIEHLNGHHFVLTLELQPTPEGTNVLWRQTFDTVEHYRRIAEFVAGANEQNLARLAKEVAAPQPAPQLSAWAREHLKRYLDTDGAEGHHWQSAVAPQYGAMPALLLTYTGRRSGTRYVAPLYYCEHEGRYLIVASKGGGPEHPGWYRNLLANPAVGVQVRQQKFEATARVVDGNERTRLWEILVKHYPPYAEYQTRTTREIPVVVLSPR